MEEMTKMERRAVARQRSDVYGLLATVYRQEVSKDFLREMKDPQLLGVLSELGMAWAEEISQKPEEELLDDLAVEYARLFLGPGKHISPHESVWEQRKGGQRGQLWGESTVEVKRLVESVGLHCAPEYSGLPDHLSVELEFMQQMTLREEQAWQEGDKETALHCLRIERKFLEEHLSCWIPVFCEEVMTEAELPFYSDMAALTRNYIEFEMDQITTMKTVSVGGIGDQER